MTSSRKLSAIGLLAAAGGIVVQIVGGADYPVVPPAIPLLVVASGIVRFAPWRWAPLAAVLVGAFMIFGLFAAGQASRLIEVDTALDTTGLWIQMVAVVVAVVSGVRAMMRSDEHTACG